MNHRRSRQRRPIASRAASVRRAAATLAGMRAATLTGMRAATLTGMRAATLAAVAALALVGCAAPRDGSTAANTTSKNAGTVEARLIAVGGSAAKGVVRFAPAGNSVSVSVFFSGVSPGDYRVALHTTGNCSSPNGFSAGPPWVAPGGAGPTVISFRVDNDSTASTSQRVAGLALDGPQGISGRAVVIHEGYTGTLDAEPDRANARVACGVIGPAARLIDLF